MKTASLKEIRDELKHLDQKELIEVCLKLTKSKKDNKELLDYLLFKSISEHDYIEEIKEEIDLQFEEINTTRVYFIKKTVRKILRFAKKYIKYSKKKETEIEILLHFCQKLKTIKPSIKNSTVLQNIYDRQILMVQKSIAMIHEDLQYDYLQELEEM